MPAELPTRACGPCTLCCKVMGIRELDKPPDRWCAHCKPGQGCAIYEERPTSCRTFVCGWLTDPTMPEALRPDRVKVVLYATRGGRLIAQCDASQPLAWKKEPVYGLLKRWSETALGRGSVVTALVGERTFVVTPQGEIELTGVDAEAELSLVARPGGGFDVRAAAKPS